MYLHGTNDDTKEWGDLIAWALDPISITYEPKINSRTVQGEKTGAGAQHEGGEDDGSTDTVEWTVNGRPYL